MEERSRMGLVEYIGAKIAGFTVTYSPRQGRTVNRMWAAISNEQSQMVKKRRWLPETEARFYNALADFRILRWGADTTTRQPRTPISTVTAFSQPVPESQALPLQVILQQQAAAMAQHAPPGAIVTKEIDEIEPEYVMSKSGMAHKPDCSSAKRTKDPKKFYTMEDAVSDPDFKKWHIKCCEGIV
jgi:hypothetical protein